MKKVDCSTMYILRWYREKTTAILLLVAVVISSVWTSLPAAVFALTNGDNALDLLGEFDETSFTNPVPVFTKNGVNNGANKFGFDSPTGVAVDTTNHILFVADTENNRIFSFSLSESNTLTDRVPDGVLGQVNFYENTPNTSRNGLNGPIDLTIDSVGMRLFVSDAGNNRVMVFNYGFSNGQNAIDLIGQYDQSSISDPVPVYTKATVNDAPNRLGMASPNLTAYDQVHNRLFIGELTNNRVLVYAMNSNGTFVDRIPDNVLGQPNFYLNTAAVTQNGLSSLAGMVYDGTNDRLFVSGSTANRVTVYDTASITNGENATNVLGQTSYTASTAATAQNRLNAPQGLAFDATNNRLYIVQSTANRVTVYDVAAITDGENAVDLIGQYDQSSVSDPVPIYTKATANDSPNRLGMSAPTYPAYDTTNFRLFLGDQTNNRVLVYQMNADGTFVDRIPDNVLGQTNFYTSTAATTQVGLNIPTGIAYDEVGNRLFVAQSTANRVTVYDVAAITNGENATNLLGKTSYTVATAATTQNGMNVPQGLAYDATNSRLFVAQSTANRVTVYDVAAITNGENATNLLGKTSYTVATAATTQNGMNVPQGLAYDSTNSRLFVAQNTGNRVTVYDVAAITIGENATNLLGQTSFTVATAAITQNGMSLPRGLAYDTVNSRLYVAQTTANRVTVYDVAAITNGENAVDLIGHYDQSSMSAPVPLYTASVANDVPYRLGLSSPTNATYDTTNNRLFVSDFSNNRVLVYAMNSDGTFVDRIPDNIIGQSNYYTGTAATTQNGVNAAHGLAFDSANNRLFVGQTTGNRVTVYDVAAITDGENASNLLGQTSFTVATAATTQNGMNVPQDLAYDTTNSRLFVSQSTANRVTVYSTASITNGQNAVDLIGHYDQTDMSAPVPLYTASVANDVPYRLGLSAPMYIAYDTVNNRLFVNDTSNTRVLVYAMNPDGTYVDRVPDNVIGKANFYNTGAATTQNAFSAPRGLAFDAVNNRLFVADATGNRILTYDTSSIVDGENAVNVIGPANFTNSGTGTAQNKLTTPSDLVFDSANNRLFVAETGNNRVTVFDTTSIPGGQNAIDMIGQYDETDISEPVPLYTKSAAHNAPNRFGFSAPAYVTYDSVNNRLFVNDQSNNRILVYATNVDGTFVDRIPDNVIGQPNYYTVTAATTQNGINVPQGIAYDSVNNRLFIGQSGGYRVTIYDTTAITDGENATNVLGQVNYTNGSFFNAQNGMASPGGLAYDSANTRLFVVQNTNASRITVYDVASITDGENATNVIGPSYTSTVGGPGQNFFSTPMGIAYDPVNNRVFIADQGNNRVVVHPTATITAGQNATNLLGQTSYTVTAAATTQPGMNVPQDVAYDTATSRLFVSQSTANRVTVYDVTAITNGENAINVLGQSSFSVATATTTQNGMNFPKGLHYDGTNNRLFVAQTTGNRVTVYDAASLTNGANAMDLLGQYDQSTVTAPTPVYVNSTAHGGPNRYGLNAPTFLALDSTGHRLFVSDQTNSRVLVYALDATNGFVDRLPDNVLGQADYHSNTAATTQNGMNVTQGLAYDALSNRLFVAQSSGNRVTVYNVASITNGQNADNVLGQSTYISAATAATQTGMFSPRALALDESNGKLFVADTGNSRVTTYSIASGGNGQNATNVIGQSTYTSGNAATTQNGLNGPTGLAYDSAGNRLFVAQNAANRVTLYNLSGFANGQNATNVLGQAGYTDATPATTQNGLNGPTGLAYDSAGSRLFVAQNAANRVTIFDIASITSGQNSTNVIGQNSFIAAGTATTQNGLNNPFGLVYDSVNSRLFIADTDNHRITAQDVKIFSDNQNAVDLLGQYDQTSMSAPVPLYTKGTANDAPNRLGLSGLTSLAYDETNNRLFVTDQNNYRVLVYAMNPDGTFVDRIPDNVLGQSNYYTGTSATSQSGMNAPHGIAFDSANNRLFVSQLTGNRVTVYDVADITNGENATNLLGQTSYTVATATTTQNGMNTPQGLAYDAGNSRLFVSQSTGNRVTVYDVADITNGENATNLLGQTSYTVATAATTQNGMNVPQGLAYDAGNNRLFVSQSTAIRVTVYDVAAITDGENATNVLGQGDYVSAVGAITQNSMGSPREIAYDSANSRLFVANFNQSRVTVYDVAAITDGENASNLLGQASYTTATVATTQNGMNAPASLAYNAANNRLFVGQNTAMRVTVYDTAAITNGENAVDLIGQYDQVNLSVPEPIYTIGVANNVPYRLGLSGPVDVAYDAVHSRLFVADTQNHRVLIYNTNADAVLQDRIPDNILGQDNYYTGALSVTQASTYAPGSLAYDSVRDRLFVGQLSGNRITVYDTASITDGENATNILGQSVYTASAAGTATQNNMNSISSLAYDSTNDRLFVAQSGFNRVSVFDTANITDGENAVDLLGQYDDAVGIDAVPVYTKNGANNGPSIYGLQTAGEVAFDDANDRLFVADLNNYRVLVYAMNSNGTFVDRIPDNVLGEPDFNSVNSTTTQNGMTTPVALAYDSPGNRLFVADTSNRVLVYDVASITNGENATNVLGQTTFTSSTAAITQSRMSSGNDKGLAFDSVNNRLFVTQTTANRVTVYDVASITDGENATNVLGQPSFTASTAAVTQNGMRAPISVAYDEVNSRLFVGQGSSASRVTVYSVASITDGQNATNVLGQSSYTTSTQAITQNGMTIPYGLAYDSANSRLFSAQSTGDRVLAYDVAAITDGENATNIIGQATYTSSSATFGQNSLNTPKGLAYDSTNSRLFIADTQNNRIAVHSVASITEGQNAVDILGQHDQTDFTNPVPYFQKRGINDGPNKLGFQSPQGVIVDDIHNRLFVSDTTNQRVLVFAMNTDGTFVDHIPDNIIGQSDFLSNAATITQSSVYAPAGLAYDSLNDRLFVSQISASRITIYDTASIVNGENAVNLLGQSLYTNSNNTNSQSGLNAPQGIAYDDRTGRLFVSQTTGNRISIFQLGFPNGQLATSVLGQPDFATTTAAATQNGMNAPKGIFFDSTLSNLFVTDGDNNRLTIYGITTLVNGQNATDLVGQYDQTSFTNPVPVFSKSGVNDGPNKFGFSGATFMAVDEVNHRMFISDSSNNRILIYGLNANHTFPDRVPDNVLGQSNYYSNAPATTQNGVSAPRGIVYDDAASRLFVSDGGNSRVLVYDIASITDGENATNVLGQTVFTAGTSGSTQSTLHTPRGLTFNAPTNHLYVADNQNNRVLQYNVAAITNGEDATAVLGQPNFTATTAAATQNGMNGPQDMVYNAATDRLFVSQNSINRVTAYDTASITNGENATNVLGQTTYTGSASANTQAGMSDPRGLAYDSATDRLFVAQNAANRVTVYSTDVIVDGEGATGVLGQTTFTGSAAASTQTGLYGPIGLAFEGTGDRLFISDSVNNRLLMFDGSGEGGGTGGGGGVNQSQFQFIGF